MSVRPRTENPTRVEIPLKNRSRYERFERFFSKIWAVWAVWAVFVGKTAQTAQILLKKPLKTAHFLRFFLNGFSSKIWAVFERSYKEHRLKPTKRPGKVMWPRVDIHKPKMLMLNFPYRKSLSYNCLHQMYGKTLVINFSYNFKKPLKKYSI